MSKKTVIATNLFFLLGILILGWMVYRLGLQTILANIAQTGWWFAGIIGIWAVVYAINAVSFHIIIRDGSPETCKISFLKTYKLIISGFAVNYVTPLGLLGGVPYKILQLEPDLKIQKATSSVLLHTLMQFVSHFIFWMISIPLLVLIVPVLTLPVKILLWIAAIASLSLLYWSFTVYTRGLVSRALSLGLKIPFVGKKVRAYKAANKEKIEQMDFLIADLYKNRKKDFIASLSLELLSRFVLCIEVVLMMHPIGYPITFSQSVLTESVSSMIANLFFFMPLQLGAREGGFALAFGILSIPVAYGVYVSICMRIREFFWTIVGLGLIKVKLPGKKTRSD
ncbi:lysylphosphatidylglycerol synthase domain-containing protein [Limibacterium fermenti]|uniref:lysylphosphatidylglycerol synthase domain-containing protein n=1 Tax=Limibacterium fermenti TaxID=3229863 RepID=UPI003A6BCF82